MFVYTLTLACLALDVSAFSIPLLPQLPHFLGVGHARKQQLPLQDSLDTWIAQQEQISLDKLLANIAPGGRNVEGKGVVAGTVVASPSKDEPDYWYQWVRDSAITMNSLVDIYSDDPSSDLGSRASSILDAYASLQHTIQRTSNPSGTFDDLSGLGEPKFTVEGKPFTGSWGRPQRDGPALRALTLMRYLREHNASHPALWLSDVYDPLYYASMPANSVIKADLEYVSHYWNESGFDLWEEVEGLHFFTLIVSSASLREGSDIAKAFGDRGAAEWYAEQAGYSERLLSKFWNTKKGHLVETLWSKRSGLDCGLLLGSLHALPPKDSTHDPVFPPWSDEILVSLLELTRDQHTRFPINSKMPSASSDDDIGSFAFKGTGIGRYPEDVYDGYDTSIGNPWFLCTSSAAEVLYRTASQIQSTSMLNITQTSLPFYASLLSTTSPSASHLAPDTYAPSSPLFSQTISALKRSADEFLAVVRAHVDDQGAMSEQFDRETGFMRGARDLTWSYGAFLSAVRARRGLSGGEAVL